MRINKNDVINAMLSEHLIVGTWNEDNNEFCSVCAVGAVFRKCLGINNYSTISKTMNFKRVEDWQYIDDHLSSNEYLAALSCFFEDLKYESYTSSERIDLFDNVNIESTDEYRFQLTMFVQEHFPNSFSIEVEI